MANLSTRDEDILLEKTGLTREAIRTMENLGFTVMRTASLLSYMKELADVAEKSGAPSSSAEKPQPEHHALTPTRPGQGRKTP